MRATETFLTNQTGCAVFDICSQTQLYQEETMVWLKPFVLTKLPKNYFSYWFSQPTFLIPCLLQFPYILAAAQSGLF